MARQTPDVEATRRRLRQWRRALPPRARRSAERAIGLGLTRLRVFRPGARVGIYLAVGGELSIAPAAATAGRAGARLYVPKVISRRRRAMVFVPLRLGTRTVANVFGIQEPRCGPGRRQPVIRLDTVIVPLVGFDRRGHRLGMGAGFYDRALSRRRDALRGWRRPRLIGVAFACQEVTAVEPASWDVPLDVVVTEREIVRCRPVTDRTPASAT